MTELKSRVSLGCGVCGSDQHVGRYCINCGTPLGDASTPAPATGSATGPTGGTRLRRFLRALARWRTVFVLVPLLSALVGAGGLGAQLLWAEIPQRSSAAEQLRCWDGSLRPDADSCGIPEGERGLRWVFPSFRPNRDSCRDVLVERPGFNRPSMWECSAQVGGRPVLISYSQLSSVEGGRRFFEKYYGGRAPENVLAAGDLVRHVWRSRGPATDSGFELTAMYARFPYAVTVVAATAADRERTISTLVDFRDVGQVVVRAESTPKPERVRRKR